MAEVSKICAKSGERFVISEQEQTFLEKMGVPLPTLSPKERMRRRLAQRNERFLYHRKCDLTGKQIIASASPEKPYPVYGIDAWWSDDWDAMDYGQEIDFKRPFFEQYRELKAKVPRMALQQQKPMENSEYCNCASRNKNCYLIFSTNHCEDCYYGSWINFSRDCLDNSSLFRGELCYETVDCRQCYNVIYAEESSNCSDSAFIKNCVGSKNLLFCTNLVNQEYCVMNQSVRKEEFEAIKRDLKLHTRSGLDAAIQKFNALKVGSFVRYYHGFQNEDTTGDHNNQCRNCHNIYECDECEDVWHSNNVDVNVKDCMDYSYWGMNATQIYECHACGYDVYNLRFCNLCWDGCHDLSYCDHCFSSAHCFGCIGLKKKQFCILNKQYSEEEYYRLMEQLVAHMQSTGEWGEFFPIESSAFAYTESLAGEWFPLGKDRALKEGFSWVDQDQSHNYQGPQIEPVDDIHDASEEITKQILSCEISGQLYKIIPQELAFYKKMGLPLPRRSPDQRHRDRMNRRNPRELWQRECAECHIPLETTYSPNRPERVLCETCYQRAVF